MFISIQKLTSGSLKPMCPLAPIPNKYAQEIYDVGVRTITVTVNAVDPCIGSKIIYPM
ncbi:MULTISPECIES: hypothetical protein [Clostridium]|uniref:Uncharacterized protein n=1 Tax=Clostridium autoethanogenum DSM 10061 TaxID=1341692 RepID=A0ABY4TQJ4_9CLOT|nr:MULTISPECIES: hypothetical protein [Clostridium]URS74433.1 hypothetical protein CAETHG_04655 [Clostridium autoethanogenum DSM 10061]